MPPRTRAADGFRSRRLCIRTAAARYVATLIGRNDSPFVKRTTGSKARNSSMSGASRRGRGGAEVFGFRIGHRRDGPMYSARISGVVRRNAQIVKRNKAT